MELIAADPAYEDLRLDDMRYGVTPAPAVLICGERARARRLGRLAEAAGARLLGDCGLTDAAGRIITPGGRVAAVMIDVTRDEGEALDRALAAIDIGVAAGRFAAIVVTTAALIDLVVAAIGLPAVTILVDPEDGQIALALAQATRPVGAVLADSAGEAAARRLAELGEEVGQIARSLIAGATGGAAAEADPAPRAAGGMTRGETATSDLVVVRTLLRLRRLRARFLEPSLFADPAWDMLLDLAAAQLEGRRVAVSSLCIAAAVPPTTALRWITAMTEQGLFARQPDPADGRRIFIALSDAAGAAMTGYLAAARNAFAAA